MDAIDRGSAFHADEIAAQRRVGMDQRMDIVGRTSVRDYMPDQHREFFAQLPFLFVAALDGEGQPWATLMTGEPGFLSTPDERTLRVAAQLLPGDPLAGQMHAGDYIGALGLSPATRRRNRANGVIEAVGDGDLRIAVQQSFGNCPKYIQARGHQARQAPGNEADAGPRVLRSAALSDADKALIAQADTFFIASANVGPSAGLGRGVDMSHRGGRPGFIRIGEDGVLTAPDFMGNFFFNTIGNLVGHPRAGLLFIDFASGDMLHLAVEAEVVWDGPEVQAIAGAERLLRFRVREVVRNVAALPFRWSEPEPSPYLDRLETVLG